MPVGFQYCHTCRGEQVCRDDFCLTCSKPCTAGGSNGGKKRKARAPVLANSAHQVKTAKAADASTAAVAPPSVVTSTAALMPGEEKLPLEGGTFVPPTVTSAVPKKVWTVENRTMSVEEAEKAKRDYVLKIVEADATVKEQGKLARSLERQMNEANKKAESAKREMEATERLLKQASQNVKPDAVRIKERAESVISSKYGLTLDMGWSLVTDMLAAVKAGDDESHLLDLASIVGSSNVCPFLEGGLRAILDADEPNAVAVQALITQTLKNDLVSTTERKVPRAPWPTIAKAILLIDDDKAAEGFVSSALEDVEAMNRANASSKSSPETCLNTEKTNEDKCPLLHILYPSWDVMRSVESGCTSNFAARAATALEAALRMHLQTSLSSPPALVPSYAMPEEAAVAARRGSPDLAKFLHSQETSVRMNLTKSGRMFVHRIIDNDIPSGFSKLKHTSEGSGRARVLVVTKQCAEGEPERLRKRAEWRQQHSLLLSSLA